MDYLATGLTVAHAESLPQAIGEVLPLLRGDIERLRFAAEIATRLDLFEVARSVADLASSTDDRDLSLAAATLCGNPAVGQSLRKRVADMLGNDLTGLIRIDPHTVPVTADEKCLYWQCWPGARTDDIPFPLAPVVVLDRGFDALQALRFAVRLDQAGAVVRRLAPEADIPLWFGSQTVLVCRPQTRTRVLSAYPGFSEAQIIAESLPEDERRLGLLLRRVDVALPGPQKLRFKDFPVEVTTNLWEPDVFMAGCLPDQGSRLPLRNRSVVAGLPATAETTDPALVRRDPMGLSRPGGVPHLVVSQVGLASKGVEQCGSRVVAVCR